MLFDLHVHLRGTLTPALVRNLAARNNLEIPRALLEGDRFGWKDFNSFLDTYDAVTAVVATPRDLEDVTYAYLADVASQGAAYVEFMLSPPDLARRGIDLHDQLSAMGEAAARARDESRIECRLIATAVRHLGPDAAEAAVRMVSGRASDLIVGFGLTGDEARYPVAAFREAFRIARSEGLMATAHAGEHLPAETIIEAIEQLELDRVGHGVRAVESPAVLRQLAEAGIPLEICISSNLHLGLYPDLDSHPIATLAAAGCVVVLGTDDPGFFGTTIEREYALAGRATGGLMPAGKLAMNSIDAAFCDEETKASLRARWATEGMDPIRPPRSD